MCGIADGDADELHGVHAARRPGRDATFGELALTAPLAIRARLVPRATDLDERRPDSPRPVGDQQRARQRLNIAGPDRNEIGDPLLWRCERYVGPQIIGL